jgi:methylated-DNA-[protein]-cysteine S-methyltransferase
MRFEERVWKLIEKIPRGRVTTYKIIAEKLGTRAYRSVGRACGMNPNAPIVACHRVVSSDGKLGGYSSGVKKKVQLLKKENVRFNKGRIVDFESLVFRFD